MILRRSGNTQKPQNRTYQSKDSFLNQHPTSHQQPPQVYIYPCCYQISPIIHLNSSTKPSQNHSCMLADYSFNLSKPLQIKSSSNSLNINLSNKENPQKQVLCCSHCQTLSVSQSLDFYDCSHCQKQFCQKCVLQVHSKGKFMLHQIRKLQKEKTLFSAKNDYFTCQTHLKPRKHLLRNKIVCELCFKQQSGKLPVQQSQSIEYSFLQENMKFTLQYFNQIYHNQANKMTQSKQNLSKLYKDCFQRLEQKYKSSLGQIQRIESNIKTNFAQNILQLSRMTTQVQLISTSSRSFCNLLPKQVINTRMHLIQQKMFQIQSRIQQFTSEISYDYKIGDKDKNEQLIQNFLKCINLIKTKRQEDDLIDTNRSSFRNNMKTSRTISRLSSNRLTTKDNRGQSSFNKHQNISSSKNHSSFKDKERNSLAKNQLNQDSNRKTNDLTKSIINTNRSSMGKSINKTSSIQQSVSSSRNNYALFNEKERKYDVKDLQKAEYQDLNLNLKKIMGNKKNEAQSSVVQSQNGSKFQSESTSLQKNNNKQNDPKRSMLIRQNEKSAVKSGSFLKVFDQKNRSGGRKNYLVSSGEELQDSETKNIAQVQSQVGKASPQGSHLVAKKKIKEEVFGSNRGNSSNKFSEVEVYDKYGNSQSVVNSGQSKNDEASKNSQKSRQSQKIQNKSLIFDKLVALSQERKEQSTVSQFNYRSGDDHIISEMTKSLVSQFSCNLTGQTTQLPTYQNFKDIPVTQSINFQEQTRKSNRSPKTGKSIAKPQASRSIFKDSTNTHKGVQKALQERVVMNEKQKKKPDFMDMRQKMRKPNYLSSRLNSNLNAPTDVMKKVQEGKK